MFAKNFVLSSNNFECGNGMEGFLITFSSHNPCGFSNNRASIFFICGTDDCYLCSRCRSVLRDVELESVLFKGLNRDFEKSMPIVKIHFFPMLVWVPLRDGHSTVLCVTKMVIRQQGSALSSAEQNKNHRSEIPSSYIAQKQTRTL